MAVTWVYIWSHSRSTSWGHSSLQVEGGPYISWWPSLDEDRVYTIDVKKHPTLGSIMKSLIGTTNVYKVKHRCQESFIADVMAEGRQPQYKVRLADGVLDTDAIQKWWKGYNYEKASYHSIKKNCSTTVIRALRAGGSDRHVPIGHKNNPFSKYTGWEPTDIVSYLRTMERTIGKDKVDFDGQPSNSVEQLGEGMCRLHNQPLLTCTDC